ncbi:MAG: hypothetical protein WDA74_01005 [Spirochaetota bacterium]
MENANVIVFTDNYEGRELAKAIESLGLTVKVVSSFSQKQVLDNYRDNYILIFNITDLEVSSVLDFAESLEGGSSKVKFIIMEQSKIGTANVKTSNVTHVEFIGSPVDKREFLLLLEKTLLVEKYKNLMVLISKESESRLEIFETVLGPCHENYSDDKADKEAFLKMIDFEKKLMKEQLNLNDAIRRIALMRNRDYFLLKERVLAEEMLDTLRQNELMNANKVIEAQEALIDYSAKEFYDARRIIDATNNVAELSRVEALELHEELLLVKKENKELTLKIKSLMDENMELKKRH